MNIFRCIAAVATILVAAIAPAQADEPAQTLAIDATTTAVSPGAVYGPWNWLAGSFRTTLGNDKPGLQIITRSDRDAGAPSSGTSFMLDDYHQFSSHAYGYASLQFASGSIFPTRGAYGEIDAAVVDGLAFGAGGGVLANPNETTQRYLSLGPTLYFHHANATLRYLPLWTQNDMGASSWLASATFGDEGRASTTFTLQDGVAPASAANIALLAPGASERAFAAGITTRHFFRPNLGYDLGLDYAVVNDRSSGAFLYRSVGVTVGVVWARPARVSK